MRPTTLSLAFILALAVPARAQTCKKVPAPPIPDLFPAAVDGLARHFEGEENGSYTNAYTAVRTGTPWAVVTIGPHADPFLGETAQGLIAHYERTRCAYLTAGDWPVAFNVVGDSDEFVALKGSVRVTVIVHGGDHGEDSSGVARGLLTRILPQVPCG